MWNLQNKNDFICGKLLNRCFENELREENGRADDSFSFFTNFPYRFVVCELVWNVSQIMINNTLIFNSKQITYTILLMIVTINIITKPSYVTSLQTTFFLQLYLNVIIMVRLISSLEK